MVDSVAERAGDRVRALAALNEADEDVDETEGDRAIEGCDNPWYKEPAGGCWNDMAL